MEYIIAIVVIAALAIGIGVYFDKKKETKPEKLPWEQPKPKRPNEPPPQAKPVPPEAVSEAINLPSPMEAVTVALEETNLGDPVKVDEMDRVYYYIKDRTYRFANKADAARFEAAILEATMSPDGLWRGRRKRPADLDSGWLKCDIWNAPTAMIGAGWLPVSVWIDPISKHVEWRDYPSQFRGGFSAPSWYWIKDGVQDVGATTWNWCWVSMAMRTDGKQLDRIRAYSGTPVTDLYRWPEEYKAAYKETH